LRLIQQRGNYALVHWWYYPDSYDTWIIKTNIFGNESPRYPSTTPCTVVVRWLTDLEKFNEYMNDRDYEPESIAGEKQYLAAYPINPPRTQIPTQPQPVHRENPMPSTLGSNLGKRVMSMCFQW
jgi:SWI/SNF related-matrix-associated actin-dependent regulator of chromatin subfamily C